MDKKSGFIHLSNRQQLKDTIRFHYKKFKKVKILFIEKDLLETNLKWEKSRNDVKFPHYYGVMKLCQVKKVIEIELKIINTCNFYECINV